jgi:hypothetical protein
LRPFASPAASAISTLFQPPLPDRHCLLADDARADCIFSSRRFRRHFAADYAIAADIARRLAAFDIFAPFRFSPPAAEFSLIFFALYFRRRHFRRFCRRIFADAAIIRFTPLMNISCLPPMFSMLMTPLRRCLFLMPAPMPPPLSLLPLASFRCPSAAATLSIVWLTLRRRR